MPFTFAHPVLFVPFRYLPRSWFSFTGLIVGSIVPDLEYIVNGTRTFSHSYSAIFWFHLPLALIIAFIFHHILRDKFISRLPAFLHSRFTRFEGFNWNMYFKKNEGIVIFSIILGTVTHLFWDSFTNVSGYFVEKIPLMQKIIYIAGAPMPFYVVIWNISSVGGMLIIAIAVYLLPKEDKNKKYSFVWLWVILMVFVILLSCLLLLQWKYSDIDTIYVNIVRGGLLTMLLITLLGKKPNPGDKHNV